MRDCSIRRSVRRWAGECDRRFCRRRAARMRARALRLGRDRVRDRRAGAVSLSLRHHRNRRDVFRQRHAAERHRRYRASDPHRPAHRRADRGHAARRRSAARSTGCITCGDCTATFRSICAPTRSFAAASYPERHQSRRQHRYRTKSRCRRRPIAAWCWCASFIPGAS